MQVLVVEKGDEFWVVEIILPSECNQLCNGFARREGLEVEAAFRGANMLVGGFEDCEVKLVLLADVVVKHALVRTGPLGDAINACATISVTCKLGGGGIENAFSHP